MKGLFRLPIFPIWHDEFWPVDFPIHADLLLSYLLPSNKSVFSIFCLIFYFVLIWFNMADCYYVENARVFLLKYMILSLSYLRTKLTGFDGKLL